MKGENCSGHPLCQAPTIDTWKKQRAENHRKPREGSTELPGANSYNISWSYKAVPTNGPYGPYKALYGNPVISDIPSRVLPPHRASPSRLPIATAALLLTSRVPRSATSSRSASCLLLVAFRGLLRVALVWCSSLSHHHSGTAARHVTL